MKHNQGADDHMDQQEALDNDPNQQSFAPEDMLTAEMARAYDEANTYTELPKQAVEGLDEWER